MGQILWYYKCRSWAFHDLEEIANLFPEDLAAKYDLTMRLQPVKKCYLIALFFSWKRCTVLSNLNQTLEQSVLYLESLF